MHIVGQSDLRLRASSDVLSNASFDEVACGTPWTSVDAAEGTPEGAACNNATKHSDIVRGFLKAIHTGKTTKNAGSSHGFFHLILSTVWDSREKAQFWGISRGICKVSEIICRQYSSCELISWQYMIE
jgi:hypothetical protein